MPMITVLVVDDHQLVRAGLVGLLDAADDLEVVGEAADGAQAIDAVRRQRPDVVLMDISMPVLDGIARDPCRSRRRIPACRSSR